MKKRICFSILMIILIVLLSYQHITVQVNIGVSESTYAALAEVQTGQIADEAITFGKLSAALQAEWNQFRGLVGSGSTIGWTIAPVIQVTSADTTLTITHGIQQYEGIGGVTLTSTPTISAGFDGQLARIRCVSDTNVLTLQSESNYAGTLLILANGRNFQCGKGDSILLSYNGLTTRWEEMSRIDIQ